MDISKVAIYEGLFECDRRIGQAELQLEHLYIKRDQIIQRYVLAHSANNLNFRVVFRGRLLVVEGLLTAYRHYIDHKKSEVVQLRQHLYRVNTDDIGAWFADDSDVAPFDSQEEMDIE